MNIKILFAYMDECEMRNDIPTWEGLKIFHFEMEKHDEKLKILHDENFVYLQDEEGKVKTKLTNKSQKIIDEGLDYVPGFLMLGIYKCGETGYYTKKSRIDIEKFKWELA